MSKINGNLLLSWGVVQSEKFGKILADAKTFYSGDTDLVNLEAYVRTHPLYSFRPPPVPVHVPKPQLPRFVLSKYWWDKQPKLRKNLVCNNIFLSTQDENAATVHLSNGSVATSFDVSIKYGNIVTICFPLLFINRSFTLEKHSGFLHGVLPQDAEEVFATAFAWAENIGYPEVYPEYNYETPPVFVPKITVASSNVVICYVRNSDQKYITKTISVKRAGALSKADLKLINDHPHELKLSNDKVILTTCDF